MPWIIFSLPTLILNVAKGIIGGALKEVSQSKQDTRKIFFLLQIPPLSASYFAAADPPKGLDSHHCRTEFWEVLPDLFR